MEQRRAQRYRLQLPLQILQVGDERVDRLEKTRDISSGGVCFLSQDTVDVGGRIEYVITLSGSTPPVRIRCLGKVLRSQNPVSDSAPTAVSDGMQNAAEDNGYEVAVTMERYSFVRTEELKSLQISA